MSGLHGMNLGRSPWALLTSTYMATMTATSAISERLATTSIDTALWLRICEEMP